MTSDTEVTGTEAAPLGRQRLAWAIVWHNGWPLMDGSSVVKLFETRYVARRYARAIGELRESRVPRVVRVRVTVEEVR